MFLFVVMMLTCFVHVYLVFCFCLVLFLSINAIWCFIFAATYLGMSYFWLDICLHILVSFFWVFYKHLLCVLLYFLPNYYLVIDPIINIIVSMIFLFGVTAISPFLVLFVCNPTQTPQTPGIIHHNFQ